MTKLHQARFELGRRTTTGSSTFFQAWDRESRRAVGLKVIAPEFVARVESRYRGLRKPSEGETLALISHPRVVTLFDHGAFDSGEHFLVIELLDGETFSEFLQRASPLEMRTDLLLQAATALAAVHTAGFLHRDICPRNFLVAPHGQSLKLIDFGLSIPSTPEFLSRRNGLGTAGYLAPEIFRREPINRRVDIFAFGVTAYEVLLRRRPPRPSSHSHEVALEQLIHEGVEPRLARVIANALAHSPDLRPSDLDGCLAAFAETKEKTRE